MAIRTLSYPTFCSLPTLTDEVQYPIRRTFSYEGSPEDAAPSVSHESTATAEIPLTQSDEHVAIDFSEKKEEVEGEGYVFPELRYPPVSKNHDTAYIDLDYTLRSAHGPLEIFMEEKHVLKKYPVRYIDCGPYPKESKVVAVTRAGKYVVWQQAIRSCVPTAISMIALDRSQTFLAKELQYAVASNENEIAYIKKAGFEPILHALKGHSYEKVQALERLILRTGPGLLHLDHPGLQSHVCVLDEISWETQCATVRDSIKGEMITIKLYPFADWIGSEFFELKERNSCGSSMAHGLAGYASLDHRKRKTSEAPEPATHKFSSPLARTESQNLLISAVGQRALTAAAANISAGRRLLMESHDEIDEDSSQGLGAVTKIQ